MASTTAITPVWASVAELPTSIGEPETSQDITSLVVATGAPAITQPQTVSSTLPQPEIATTSTPSSFTSTTSKSSTLLGLGAPTGVGSTSTPLAEKVDQSNGLDSAQVTGIALGASAVVLITLAFLFHWCRHRKKPVGTRSNRRPLDSQQSSHPTDDGPTTHAAALKTSTNDDSSTLRKDSTSRFYADVAQDYTRSFWTRSIRPEEIGVAITSTAKENTSPASMDSHQSRAKLIPKNSETSKGQDHWFTSASLSRYKRPSWQYRRPLSASTVFDEDIETGAAINSSSTCVWPSNALDLDMTARPRKPPPAMLRMPPKLSEPHADRRSKNSRPAIALTPTYDNGNFPETAIGRRLPDSWKASKMVSSMESAPHFVQSEDHDGLLGDAMRDARQSNTEMTMQAGAELPVVDSRNERPGTGRKESDTTLVTIIDEKSTPGEIENPLESGISSKSVIPMRSPITNLRYPAVPRSAGVSRQAEHLPQPRPLDRPHALSSPRPSRDVLVWDKGSFLLTDTTSSDGYLSDRSTEWPMPPPVRPPLTSKVAKTVNSKNIPFVVRSGTDHHDEEIAPPRKTRKPAPLAQLVNVAWPPRAPTYFENTLTPRQAEFSHVASSAADDLYFTVEV